MSTVASPVRSVKPARKIHVATRPATGSCRWAAQPGLGRYPHPGVLVITTEDPKTGLPVSTAYTVRENRDGGRLAGYSLTKRDGKVYDLPAALSGCDCPDREFHPERPGGCRHMKALAAALRSLGGEMPAAA
jgi:hypothetical protein